MSDLERLAARWSAWRRANLPTDRRVMSLGRGDGVVVASASERKVYVRDESGHAYPAVLDDGCGIPLLNVTRWAGRRVRVEIPPGETVYVVRGVERDTFPADNGQTGMEQLTAVAGMPGLSALTTLRVEATEPLSDAVQVRGPVLYHNPVTDLYQLFEGAILSVTASISALSSGQHQLAAVALNTLTNSLELATNTAVTATGALPAASEFTDAHVLTLPFAQHHIPLGILYLYYGQQEVQRTDIYRMYDPRPLFSARAKTLNVTHTITGTLSVTSGALRFYNPLGRIAYLARCTLGLGTAASGAYVIVDVHKSGVTVFTNQANRPQVQDGANTGSTTSFDVSAWGASEYLTFDVDQVGSGTAGSDLTISLIFY